MTLLFFNRCEGTNDGTGDLNSGGDSSWTAVGSASFDPSANCGIGTNGMLIPSGGSNFRKDTSTNIVDPAEGCCGFLWYPTALASGQLLQIRGGTAANQYSIFINATSAELLGRAGDPDGSNTTVTTAGATDFAINNLYGIILRWDYANDTLRIELWGDPLGTPTLLDSAETTGGFAQVTELASGDRFRIGSVDGTNNQMFIKNIFICDAYADPIEANFGITHENQFDYGGSGAAVTGSGALTSTAATAAATGSRGVQDSGGVVELVAPAATLAGEGTVTADEPQAITGTGALTSTLPEVAGTAVGPGQKIGDGALIVPPAVLAAVGVRGVVGDGALTSPRAFLNGVGPNVSFGERFAHNRAVLKAYKRSIKYAHGFRKHG